MEIKENNNNKFPKTVKYYKIIFAKTVFLCLPILQSFANIIQETIFQNLLSNRHFLEIKQDANKQNEIVLQTAVAVQNP